VCVEEQDDIYDNLIYVESVSEKEQMLENYQVLENQVGRKLENIYITRINSSGQKFNL